MAVLLILCEAHQDDARTQLLKDAITEFGDILPVSHSSYLVYCERSSEDVARTLKQKISFDHAESLMVIAVPDPYTGPAPLKVKLWFDDIKRKVRGSYQAAAELTGVAAPAEVKPKQA